VKTAASAIAFPLVGSTRTKTRVETNRTDEQQLVQRIQSGDEIAFRQLVDRYQAKVLSIVHGVLRNHNDAEDIAQQVFAKIYLSVGKFDNRSSLLTWIYKITVNECYDYLRKKRVRKLVYESDFNEEDSQRMEYSASGADSAPTADVNLERRDIVVKLMGKISEEERQLMMLKEVEGHSVEELASMMGMNENTIKVKLFRTRQKLVKAAERLGIKFGAGNESDRVGKV
jgi:RNA polymerase sigma-70 factor, ECF subfamily